MLEHVITEAHHPPSNGIMANARELWSLRGANDTLRALAIETSFGYTFALELDGEIVLQHLQPNIDALLTYSARMHAALLAQGWQRTETSSLPVKEPS
jgi:hypothetical protein